MGRFSRRRVDVANMERPIAALEVLEGLHDDYYISTIMMNADPTSVRMEQRIEAGKFTINGVSLSPAEATIAIGKKIIAFRTETTVAAIRRAIASEPR